MHDGHDGAPAEVGGPRLDEITDRLTQIGEDLADYAVSLLGRALDTPEEHERIALANLEKRVTKARRAVEKAADALR